MATLGRGGCIGVQTIFGDKDSSARFLVQIPGSAARMSRSAFLRAMKAMPAFCQSRGSPKLNLDCVLLGMQPAAIDDLRLDVIQIGHRLHVSRNKASQA